MIEEFNINIPEKDIDLLKQKINLTRWPDEVNNKWSHGTDKSFLKGLSNYWCNEFNWSVHEKKLNEIGSFKYTSKSGLKIHFLHSKSKNDNAPSKQRLQDRELQEMSDHGMCLSMPVSYTHLTLPTKRIV